MHESEKHQILGGEERMWKGNFTRNLWRGKAMWSRSGKMLRFAKVPGNFEIQHIFLIFLKEFVEPPPTHIHLLMPRR